MKYKKYIIFFSLLTLTPVLLAVPANGKILGGFLDPNTYVRIHGNYGRNDGHVWEFVSNASEILVLALDSEEYDEFFHHEVSEYTALLCDGKLSGSGIWRPPSYDYWHIIYINIGSVQTFIVIEHSTEWKYYSKDLGPESLIIGFTGFFTVVGLGGVILGLQHFRKKRE